MNTKELYGLAEQKGIEVNFWNFTQKGYTIAENGVYEIVLACKILCSQIQEKEVLAEELAHCLTGTVYPPSLVTSPQGRLTIAKCERIAKQTAATLLVPLAALKPLLSLPYYEIAEELNVSEKTVITAVEYYQLRGML